MRLTRLEVRGFKSFADRTEFDFVSDLTGIVGPNGCGKSNVVDALKWVLGDQRAKSLRGAEMLDVIFKGAEGRDGLYQAEVQVHLEDDEGRLGDRTEVVIGRRLNRDKESSYLVNGEAVRLKDVRDLLMDTGLGVGAYSVMEQGRIDAVLSANPEDRRAIFEEAAGISRFKLQKRETLRKLERTEQNLARVKDLLDERARRIRSLKIQAGKARRWRELRSRLRDLRTSVAVVDAETLREQQLELAARRATLDERLASVDERVAAAGQELASWETKIVAAETELATAQEAVRAATSRREQLAARREELARRRDELDADAEACSSRAAGLGQQRDERAGELERARARLVELERRVIELRDELETKQDGTKAAQVEVRALQAELETARESRLEWIHRRTRERNRAHEEESQLRGLAARRTRLDEREAAFRTERGTRRAEQEHLVASRRDLDEREAHFGARHGRVLEALERADHEAAELSRLTSSLRERLASAMSRLEVLEGMEAHHEGVDQGPKFLLGEQPEGLRGRLLDLLDVEYLASAALEAALGPYTQALVVDTRAHAEAMLDRLRDEKKGRALLLVEEEFSAEFERDWTLQLPDGCEFLVKKLEYRDAVRPILHWLLRGVVLVDGIEHAQAHRHDLCFVTRDGTLLCGPRMEGGAASETQAGLVVRKAQIRVLREEVDDLEAQLAGLHDDQVSIAGRAERLSRHATRLDRARRSVGERRRHVDAELARVRGRIEDVAAELVELADERDDVGRQRTRCLASLGDHLLNEHLVRLREEREAAREADVAQRLEAARSTADAAVGAEHDVRVTLASTTTDREAEARKIDVHERTLVDLERAGEELDDRRREALAGIEQSLRDADACARDEAALAEEVDGLAKTRDGVEAELNAARAGKAESADAVRVAETDRSEVLDDLGRAKLDAADFEHRFVRLEERLRDDTGVELRRVLGEVRGRGLETRDCFGPRLPADAETRPDELFGPSLPDALLEAERGLERLWEQPEFDAQETAKEAQVFQAQVDRLGAVNVDAVAELDEEEQKFSGLEQDVTDLTESRRSLIEALRKMETESRTLFEETFNEARENFRTIFRKLFQGGRADMFLTESEDSLEAGIEIVAKPPGKELQSIALLSGGERSLTALAILFAVFKVKPSPFCILDEVDAALDETNVERFLRVLDDFVGPTQFCVVTHHKRTMAHCQQLYGITMEKRGVSTRLAVSLDEADAFAESGGVAATAGRADGGDLASKQRIAGEENIGFE